MASREPELMFGCKKHQEMDKMHQMRVVELNTDTTTLISTTNWMCLPDQALPKDAAASTMGIIPSQQWIADIE